jgi:hypothetical protein
MKNIGLDFYQSSFFIIYTHQFSIQSTRLTLLLLSNILGSNAMKALHSILFVSLFLLMK